MEVWFYCLCLLFALSIIRRLKCIKTDQWPFILVINDEMWDARAHKRIETRSHRESSRWSRVIPFAHMNRCNGIPVFHRLLMPTQRNKKISDEHQKLYEKKNRECNGIGNEPMSLCRRYSSVFVQISDKAYKKHNELKSRSAHVVSKFFVNRTDTVYSKNVSLFAFGYCSAAEKGAK